jgi:hypothetical protein
MEAGLALMATAGGGTICEPELDPHPAIDNKRGQIETNKATEQMLRVILELITVFSCRAPRVWPRDPRGDS